MSPNKPLIYGSSWLNLPKNKQQLLTLAWLLPHDIRRSLIKQVMPKEYWRILSTRSELEKSFRHTENEFTYGLQGNHKTKSIFVHIPKCAGISMANSIYGHAVPHSTITDYQIMFGKEIFDSYFKFTIVRNPWGRLVSAYTFLKKGGFDKNDKLWAKQHIFPYKSFEDFVKNIPYNKELLLWPHFTPQYKWILSPLNSSPLNHIGKLENLNSELLYLSDKLNLLPIKNKIINSSNNSRHYSEFYSEKTKNIVADLYRKDIKLLGYNFEN